MIKNIFKATTLLAILSLTACENQMAKIYGGTMAVELEKDQKLVNVSWKSNGSLWLLTRVRKDNEQPETYKYIEKSTYGVFEGTVIIQEK
jgi:photosystem II stability/assembly factor-like uncharacterized protein